jgi:DNA-binding FadR family transcriptional regulator
VNDPHQIGDMSLVPDWLDALSDEPDRAALILDELLEVRRVLAVRLIVRHRAEVLGAVNRWMANAPVTAGLSPEGVWEIDVQLARDVIGATGNTVALALLSSLERSLAGLPLLVAAMYADPARNLAAILAVVDAIRDGGDVMANVIEQAMTEVDRQTVSAFRRLLARS